MKNKIGLIAILLWVVTIGAFGYFYMRGWTSESSDRRTAIHLAPAERDLVLVRCARCFTPCIIL